MKNQNYLVIVLCLVVFGLVYFSFFYFSEEININLVDSEEFEGLMEDNSVFVINAHTPYIGEINGTDLIAENWKDMASYSDKLPEDKNTKILIYCRSGGMSGNSAQQLVDLGYKNVYDLSGGMRKWEESGRELKFKDIEK